jgi:hypothetical protein
MARFRVERIIVEELFVDTENIDDACQWARNFYGIQTSPAFGQLRAAVLSGEGVPAAVAEQGVALEVLDASRMQPGA